MIVNSRTSTGPGVRADVTEGVGTGAGSGDGGSAGSSSRAGTPNGSVGSTSSATNRAVSADCRWGCRTRPTGCSVAAWRSTSTVRSVAATGVVVTTAMCARDVGPQRARVAEEEGGDRATFEPGVGRVVRDQHEVGPGPRLGCGPRGAEQ